MNITSCPQCGGRVRSVTIGWKCENCNGFIDMRGEFHQHKEEPFMPPMTNADRIRAMSDEELAKFLCNFRSCDSSEHPCNGCQAEPYCMIGHNGMIDWLQKPVEDCEACHDGVCDIPGVIVQDEATEFTRDQWNWLLGRFTREE